MYFYAHDCTYQNRSRALYYIDTMTNTGENYCNIARGNQGQPWTLVVAFCFHNCLDLMGEKFVLMIEKRFWNSRLKAWEFVRILEITRTIYSNSEWGQYNFWDRMLFSTCSYRLVLTGFSDHIRTIRIQIVKIETYRKSKKSFIIVLTNPILKS